MVTYLVNNHNSKFSGSQLLIQEVDKSPIDPSSLFDIKINSDLIQLILYKAVTLEGMSLDLPPTAKIIKPIVKQKKDQFLPSLDEDLELITDKLS